MTQSLLLDQDSWDLLVDINGNIAVADEPYRIAQDVATQCKLFKGEYWYDTSQGIPYFQQILGHLPPLPLLKAAYVTVAKTVVSVVDAVCFISGIDQATRKVSGQIQSTDVDGNLITTVL